MRDGDVRAGTARRYAAGARCGGASNRKDTVAQTLMQAINTSMTITARNVCTRCNCHHNRPTYIPYIVENEQQNRIQNGNEGAYSYSTVRPSVALDVKSGTRPTKANRCLKITSEAVEKECANGHALLKHRDSGPRLEQTRTINWCAPRLLGPSCSSNCDVCTVLIHQFTCITRMITQDRQHQSST